ncbi:MAG: helix-turn-helix domain-containing protein [Actinophytocola sp.]|nr:helix-turn-helix domain-containing protein [Actinophytocola sp.]
MAPPARGLLTCVWSRRIAPADTGPHRIVPDGCVDVIWHRDSGELLVAGPDTRAHVASTAPGELVGARFHTGRSPAGLGVPADALRDGRVALADLWRPDRARRLADALAATGSITAAQAVLTDAVRAGVRAEADPAVPALLHLARDGARVGAMAEAVGLTERQLHRRCLAAFGYGAKVLQRVLRFDQAMLLARGGTALVDVAYRAGYADQAHLSQEVKALAGVSPTELLGI